MTGLEGHVIRPPAEADSVILQATVGCPHNRCGFCGTYRSQPYRVRTAEEFSRHTAREARNYPQSSSRVFLADGDVMCLSTDTIIERFHLVREHLPLASRFSLYARAEGILEKSEKELRCLHAEGLRTAYLGLESGSDEILTRIDKGSTAEAMILAVHKAEKAGIRMSVMALIGLGGQEKSSLHARETARVLTAMNPRFISLLTLRILPGTEMMTAWKKGLFTPLREDESLRETSVILTGLFCTRTIFRSDHASNPLPLAGNLPRDKERMLAELNMAEAGALPLRPSWLRGL